MSVKHVLALIVAAMLIGWFLPGTQTPASQPHTAAMQTDSGPTRPKAMAGTGESTFSDDDLAFGTPQGAVLKRQDDGHFYANVDINGKGIHFLIDTGASGIALTADDARALGLNWSEEDLETVGRGANGEVQGVPITLGNVELGGIQARSLEAVIIPDGLDVSLLGQSFLAKAQSVKINGDKMELN